MKKELYIEDNLISKNSSVYIIAEMSANHLMSFERAKQIIYALRDSGVNAIKLQSIAIDRNSK